MEKAETTQCIKTVQQIARIKRNYFEANLIYNKIINPKV